MRLGKHDESPLSESPPNANGERSSGATCRDVVHRGAAPSNWATRLLPPEQRTTIARSFNTVGRNRLDDRTRDASRGSS